MGNSILQCSFVWCSPDTETEVELSMPFTKKHIVTQTTCCMPRIFCLNKVCFYWWRCLLTEGKANELKFDAFSKLKERNASKRGVSATPVPNKERFDICALSLKSIFFEFFSLCLHSCLTSKILIFNTPTISPRNRNATTNTLSDNMVRNRRISSATGSCGVYPLLLMYETDGHDWNIKQLILLLAFLLAILLCACFTF